MSNKKYITLPGGKECRPVNPFPLTEPSYYRMGDIVIDHPNSEYKDFEANIATYDITELCLMERYLLGMW